MSSICAVNYYLRRKLLFTQEITIYQEAKEYVVYLYLYWKYLFTQEIIIHLGGQGVWRLFVLDVIIYIGNHYLPRKLLLTRWPRIMASICTGSDYLHRKLLFTQEIIIYQSMASFCTGPCAPFTQEIIIYLGKNYLLGGQGVWRLFVLDPAHH